MQAAKVMERQVMGTTLRHRMMAVRIRKQTWVGDTGDEMKRSGVDYCGYSPQITRKGELGIKRLTACLAECARQLGRR